MPAPTVRPFIWVTRAEPGAGETAAQLGELGLSALVEPVIETRELEASPAPLGTFDAIAFTSGTAVRLGAARIVDRSLPVFAVGDATAHLARDLGWGDVRSANGNINDLARLIASVSDARTILHPGARIVAGDLSGALESRGRKVAPWPLYETVERTGPSADLLRRLSSAGVHGVLVHSPSAARSLANWLLPMSGLPHARLFALSGPCARPLEGVSFREIHISPFPREASLLKVVSETFARAGL
jgi:uroporphyrinogen-III synthase